MNSSERVASPADGPELFIDLEGAGWVPGTACPNCGHGNVHAIVRAGILFRDIGSWEVEEILGIYEAFCPNCDWLPPVHQE
jgi:ribosomal protein S27AE